MNRIVHFVERQAFGVCQWWGRKLGIEARTVRKYFIYTSFIALGSPLIVYLFMAFVLEHKEYFKPRPRCASIWDL